MAKQKYIALSVFFTLGAIYRAIFAVGLFQTIIEAFGKNYIGLAYYITNPSQIGQYVETTKRQYDKEGRVMYAVLAFLLIPVIISLGKIFKLKGAWDTWIRKSIKVAWR